MKNKKGEILTAIGILIMILMTATKAVPSSKIAGYSVFVGLAFFFITEAAGKTPRAESGLRFNTVLADLKKPGVTVWTLLPVVSAVVSCSAGRLIFGDEFSAHILERAGAVLSFDKIALMIIQVVIAAFGEEIAYRGFFLGKGMKMCPFWLCAVVSSAVFAAGHIAAGDVGTVLFDVAGVFVDSLIFSVIYRKTDNCAVSTLAHILGNTAGIAAAVMLG